MSMAIGSKLELAPGSWAELVYDICIGVAVGAHHSYYIISKWWLEQFIHPIFRFFEVIEDSYNDSNGNNKLKVVAVGYGRTGTVRAILSWLPFNCYYKYLRFGIFDFLIL